MTSGRQPPATRSVRVLTVDDQDLFRGVARDVIDATPGFEAVGEATNGEEGLAAVERLSPELVLLDVRMPGIDGIELATRLLADLDRGADRRAVGGEPQRRAARAQAGLRPAAAAQAVGGLRHDDAADRIVAVGRRRHRR